MQLTIKLTQKLTLQKYLLPTDTINSILIRKQPIAIFTNIII